MARSLTAIVAGFGVMVVGLVLITAVVAKILPGAMPGDGPPGAGYLLLSLIYCYGFAILGGYVAAWVAGRAPVSHAVGLGVVMALMFAAFMKVNAGGQPRWYEYALLGTAAPAVWGGWLKAKRVNAQGILLKQKLESLNLVNEASPAKPEEKP